MNATFPARMKNTTTAAQRFGALVPRMASWLVAGDPCADQLVHDTRSWPQGRLQRTVELALRQGLAAVDDPPDSLRELVAIAQTLPTWLDPKRVERGAAFFMSTHALGGLVLGARSLILGYAAPAGNKPLVMSGRLERSVNRRLAETSKFVFDVSRPEGLRPGGDGVVSSVMVRLIHARVRQMIHATSGWNEEWGVPINQHDMMGTVLLFSLVLLEGLEQLGLRPSADEAEDYLHLWRYVGYLLGVDPELLPATRAEAERLKAFIDLTQGEPDDDARQLTRAFLEAGGAQAPTEESARRSVAVGQALARELLGKQMADALAIPDSPYRLALPLVKVAVRRLNTLRRHDRGRTAAAAAGERHWQWVLANNPQGPVHLTMPDRLLRTQLGAGRASAAG